MGYFDGDYFDPGYFDPGYWGTPLDAPAAPGCWGLSASGLLGTGVEASGSNYPFVDPEPELRGILADAYLAHAEAGAALPLRLAWMHGFDRAVNCDDEGPASSLNGDDPTPTHAVDVLIVDGGGAVVFDSTTAGYYTGEPFGDRLLIHEWRTNAAVCRVVQHTAVAFEGDARLLPATIRPARGQLDERASELMPGRIATLGPGGTPFTADVTLVAGYNVEFTAADASSGLRRVTTITVDAAPGGGAGRAPGCDPDEVLVRRINGQGADGRGNLAVGAQDCLWLRRADASSSLTLGYDCAPCCDCGDYERVQRGILRSWDVYDGAAGVADTLIDDYQAMADRWEAEKACREAQTVRLNILVNGPYLEVAASFCNTTAACADDVTLAISLLTQDPARASAPVGSSGVVKDSLGNVTNRTVAYGSRPMFALASLPGEADDWYANPPVVVNWIVVVEGTTVSVRFRYIVGGGADPGLPGVAVVASHQRPGEPAITSVIKSVVM